MSSENGQQYDLDFGEEIDLQPKRATAKIGGRRHVVKEANGGVAKQYKNACMRGTKMDDGKIVGMEGLADAEYLLVSLCTFSVDTLGDGSQLERPVPQKVVESWPNHISSKLYTWIKEHSHLHEAENEDQLVREIEKLQERLSKLKKHGPFPSGPQGSGTAGFDLPTNSNDLSTNS